MITVPLAKATIPHETIGDYKSASVLLRPAVPGTGVIAGVQFVTYSMPVVSRTY